MNPQPQQPNFIERLLPTIGSVGGGIIGGLIGGVAGTPADIATGPLGTVGGAVAGSAVGGGLGQSGGKWLENELTHTPSTAKSLIGNGLEGAAFNGVGGALGGLFGKGAEAAMGALPVSGKLANAASDTSARLLQNQLQGGLGVLKQNPLELMGRLAQGGIHDARQIPQIYNIISGATGALPKAVRSLAASAGAGGSTGVDTTGLLQMAKDALEGDLGIGLSNADKKGVLNTVISALKASQGLSGHVGLQLDNGSDAFGALRGLEKSASTQFGRAFDNAGNVINHIPHQLGTVYNNLADELEGRIFSNTPVTDELKTQIINDIAPLKDINPNYFKAMVSKIQAAKTGPDLRSAQADIVNASKVFNANTASLGRKAAMGAVDLAKNATPLIGLATGNPLAFGASLLPKILGSQAADRTVGSILGNIGRSGAEVPAGVASTVEKVAPRLSRLGALLGASGGGAISGLTQAGNNVPTQPITENQNVNPYLTGATEAPTSNQLYAQMNLAGLFGNSGAVPALQNALKAEAAQSLLNEVENSYQNAGGGQGILGGISSKLTSLLPGTAAYNYNRQQAQTAQALGTLLGISPSAVQSALPSLWTNPTAAQNEFMSAQGVLAPMLGPVLSRPQ